MSTPERKNGGKTDKDKNVRPRFFDKNTRNMCWAKADTVAGRHPDRWRKDSAGNIVCKRLCMCSGCLCYEYDHILPFSKVLYGAYNTGFLTQWLRLVKVKTVVLRLNKAALEATKMSVLFLLGKLDSTSQPVEMVNRVIYELLVFAKTERV